MSIHMKRARTVPLTLYDNKRRSYLKVQVGVEVHRYWKNPCTPRYFHFDD